MVGLSPVTTQWETLFWTYTTIGVTVGAVVIGLLVYAVVKYRARRAVAEEPRDAPRAGKVPEERGTITMALILVAMVGGILFSVTLGTMQTVDLIEKPPEGTLNIRVTAFQWGWKFTYPNGVETVGEVRVPKDEVVVFYVTSSDVFHKFQLIEFKIGVDAIPGVVNRIWIKPAETGTYTIQCFELCGSGHSFMVGKLIVMEPSEFEEWYSSKGG